MLNNISAMINYRSSAIGGEVIHHRRQPLAAVALRLSSKLKSRVQSVLNSNNVVAK
jgi:hypothetical protein